MTKAEAIIEVRRLLGNRGTDQNDNIVLSMRRAQRLLEKGQTLPRFLIVEDGTITGLADVSTGTLPTGFLREVDDEPWFFSSDDDDAIIQLQKVPYDKLLQIGRSEDDGTDLTGNALYYALRTGTVELRPIPESAWTLTGSYYKAADTLDSASSNAWLTNAPEVLYGAAAMAIAKDLRDDKGFEIAQSLYKEAQARLLADDIEYDLGNSALFMGSQA